MDIKDYIHDGLLNILVKPNSPKTEIIGYNSATDSLKVNVHARPEDNKANIELIKFFARLLKKKVTIKTGLTSKQKILKIG
jgi:hypothetical protein